MPSFLQVKGEAEVVRRVLKDLASSLRAFVQSRPADLVRNQQPHRQNILQAFNIAL